MGKELAALYPVARETFDEADAALGYKLSQLCFEGPEDQLKLTEITQPAILTVSVAAWRVLQSKGITPSYVAGHSLGEYSAHVAAGTLSFTDAVRTVRNRGKYMQEAVPVGVGAMAAVLALGQRQGAADMRRSGAGRDLPGGESQLARSDGDFRQQSSGGARRRAGQTARSQARHHAAGQRSLPLRPDAAGAGSSGSGSARADLPRPAVPVMCNVDATLVTTAEQARDALIRQVTGAVQWDKSMRALIGVGRAKLRRGRSGKSAVRTDAADRPLASCFNVEDEASLQKTMSHFSPASPKPD